MLFIDEDGDVCFYNNGEYYYYWSSMYKISARLRAGVNPILGRLIISLKYAYILESNITKVLDLVLNS